MIAQLHESLRRLQTDYIDLFWLHGWDRGAPFEETLPAWVAAQAQTIAGFRGWAPITTQELGVNSAEVALAWVRGRPGIGSTLIGARTVDQLRANLASLDVALTPEQRATLDEVSAPTLDSRPRSPA